MMARDGERFRPDGEDEAALEDAEHTLRGPERRQTWPPMRQISALAGMCVILSSAIYWLGGQMISPGQRMTMAAAAQSAELATFKADVLRQQAVQDSIIRAVVADGSISLALQCYGVPVTTLQNRGLYLAAARCDSLRRTGR